MLIAILARGIGTSSALFTIVDAVLLRPLPYRDPGRLVALTAVAADPKFDSNGSLPYSDFEELKAHARSFEDLAITYRTGWSEVTLTGGIEPQRIQAAFVSPNLFALFGRTPILGRTFTVDEDRRGDRLAVLSQDLASLRYGSAAAAVGRDIEIGGAQWRVIGIMPSDFRVPFLSTQLWMPLHAHPEWNDRREANPRLLQRWDVIARLKPGVRIYALSIRAQEAFYGAVEDFTARGNNGTV
ncbi:MAG: ABC transporter permease [Bryobacteraceae bacterium]